MDLTIDSIVKPLSILSIYIWFYYTTYDLTGAQCKYIWTEEIPTEVILTNKSGEHNALVVISYKLRLELKIV